MPTAARSPSMTCVVDSGDRTDHAYAAILDVERAPNDYWTTLDATPV
jgi:hypothetical protein